MGKKLLPFKTLVPRKAQVAHIGLKGGLHEKSMVGVKAIDTGIIDELEAFHGRLSGPADKLGRFMENLKKHDEGYGGWGHPADHEHCINLFEESSFRPTWSDFLKKYKS
jgi:hypothetical protein